MAEIGQVVYVWQLPVRITHWVNVICILILTLTGIYIAHPIAYSPDTFLGISGLSQATGQFFMGTVRYIHFVTAFVFTASVLLRIYWLFAGNQYARWKQWLPTRAARRRGIRRMMSYYLFIRRDPPAMIGHNPLAGTAYTVLFGLFLLQIITGFTLYSVPFAGGFWPVVFGWIHLVLGVQIVRFLHDTFMWLIIAFFVHHFYTAILIDIEERSGLISSIFTGYKSFTRSHLAAARAEDTVEVGQTGAARKQRMGRRARRSNG